MSRADPQPIGRALLEQGLEEHDCQALVVLAGSSRDPDLAAFVGPVHLGECLVVLPRGGTPRLAYTTPMERGEAAATGFELLSPARLEIAELSKQSADAASFLARLIERVLDRVEVPKGRILLGGHGRAGDLCGAAEDLRRRGYVPVPGNELVLRFRKHKDQEQRCAARRCAEGVRVAFRRVAALLAAARSRDGELWVEGERLTVARLKQEVALVLARHGLEQPEGNLIAPGEEGSVPHNTGSPERVLRSGESLVVDLFPRGHLFADCTRTFCVGSPPESLARAHGEVMGVLEASRRRLVPGARGWDLQLAACHTLREAGYPTPVSDPGTLTGYVHNLGHGVGFELHEFPSFRKSAGPEGVLAEGDLLVVEPGLYDPEAGWGVRVEDLLLLGADGSTNLTPLPYALDPRAWEATAGP